MKKIGKYNDLKLNLKSLGNLLRNLKNDRRNPNRKESISELDSEISGLKYEVRHKFIAYCELRGTPYEKIEKPHPNNPSNREFIENIKKNINRKIEDENVCSLS